MELSLYHLRQTVYPQPQVCIPAGNVDVLYLADVTEHLAPPLALSPDGWT